MDQTVKKLIKKIQERSCETKKRKVTKKVMDNKTKFPLSKYFCNNFIIILLHKD